MDQDSRGDVLTFQVYIDTFYTTTPPPPLLHLLGYLDRNIVAAAVVVVGFASVEVVEG